MLNNSKNEVKMPEGKVGKRVVVYDWLRLFATIFVVVGHSSYLNIQAANGGVSYKLPADLSSAYYSFILEFSRKIVGWVYGFHMPLFFMLSGAVLALKKIPPFDQFIVSKFKRLLMPYFIYGYLFMLPIKYIGGFYDIEGLRHAASEFLLFQDSGHLWFLPALFWCMIVFVIIQKIIVKKTNSIYLLLLVAGLVNLTYTYFPFDVLGLKKGLDYIFWFALGYVFENERRRHTAWNLKKTIFAFIILNIIEILDCGYDILGEFLIILCGSFYTYLFSNLCSRLLKNITNLVAWKLIIRNLFYIYLFHDPLEYIFLRIFIKGNLLKSAFGCYSYVFCRIFVAFFISLLLGELIVFIKKKLIIFFDSENVKDMKIRE